MIKKIVKVYVLLKRAIKNFKRKLKDEIVKGKYIDKEGNILGEHEGYQLYTIGQRRGLGINLSKIVFITEIRAKTNEIVLGEFSELFTNEIELTNTSLQLNLKNKRFKLTCKT